MGLVVRQLINVIKIQLGLLLTLKVHFENKISQVKDVRYRFEEINIDNSKLNLALNNCAMTYWGFHKLNSRQQD